MKDWADRHEYREMTEGCVVRSDTSGVIKKNMKIGRRRPLSLSLLLSSPRLLLLFLSLCLSFFPPSTGLCPPLLSSLLLPPPPPLLCLSPSENCLGFSAVPLFPLSSPPLRNPLRHSSSRPLTLFSSLLSLLLSSPPLQRAQLFAFFFSKLGCLWLIVFALQTHMHT